MDVVDILMGLKIVEGSRIRMFKGWVLGLESFKEVLQRVHRVFQEAIGRDP